MAEPRRFELDELLIRPGTYFNPQTEVLVVVDDSPDLDAEIFNMEEFEGADWVLVADDTPVDENRRDELLEAFQVHYNARAARRSPSNEATIPIANATTTIARLTTGPIATRSSVSSFTPTSPSTTPIVSSR